MSGTHRIVAADNIKIDLTTPDSFEIVVKALRHFAEAEHAVAKELSERRIEEADNIVRGVLMQLEYLHEEISDLAYGMCRSVEREGVLIVRTESATIESLVKIREELGVWLEGEEEPEE